MTTEADIISKALEASEDDLNAVVQSIFDDSTAQVVPGWDVKSLGAPSFGVGTLALLLVNGAAVVSGSRRGWSSVLKVMDHSVGAGQERIGSVDREAQAYRSGLFADGSSGFRAARAYLVADREPDEIWLWTEDLSGYAGPPWSREMYLQAAEVLGRLKGRLHRAPGLYETWMNRGAGVDRWLNPNMTTYFEALEEGAVSGYVRESLPGALYDRALAYPADMRVLTEALSRVPTTIAHADCHVRNLFATRDVASDFGMVAIDLAAVGIEPVGIDAGTLLGSSLTWGDDEAATVMDLEAEYFAAFDSGIRSETSETSRALIRMSYLTTVCGYGMLAAIIPAVIEAKVGPWEWALERYGGPGVKDQLPSSYRARNEYVAPLFDEALRLAGQI